MAYSEGGNNANRDQRMLMSTMIGIILHLRQYNHHFYSSSTTTQSIVVVSKERVGTEEIGSHYYSLARRTRYHPSLGSYLIPRDSVLGRASVADYTVDSRSKYHNTNTSALIGTNIGPMRYDTDLDPETAKDTEEPNISSGELLHNTG